MKLTWDRAQNTLRLTPGADQGVTVREDRVEGLIDVGRDGVLIGVELPESGPALEHWRADALDAACISAGADGTTYVEITSGVVDDVRSQRIELRRAFDAQGRLTAIVIPRRGHGYEISYPSGNQ